MIAVIGPCLNVASISLRGSKVLKQVALAHKREVGQSTKSNTRMTRIEKNHFCSIKHVSVINTILASILLFNINGDLWVKPVKPGATNGLKLDNLDGLGKARLDSLSKGTISEHLGR